MISPDILSPINIDSSTKEEIAKKRVRETAEKYNLDTDGELNEVDVGYLSGAIARTHSERDGASVVFDNESFFDQSKAGQELAALHELLHVKQFNKSLGEWAYNEIDASEEFSRELDTGYKTSDDLEGEVELITDSVFPYSFSSFYPYQKASKKNEWEQKGFDLEEELFDEAKQEVENNYDTRSEPEIYGIAIEDNVYHEVGNIAGFDYEFTAFGEHADTYGPEIAKVYREILSGYLEPEEDYFDSGALEDFGNYWKSLEKAYDEDAEYTSNEDEPLLEGTPEAESAQNVAENDPTGA